MEIHFNITLHYTNRILFKNGNSFMDIYYYDVDIQ